MLSKLFVTTGAFLLQIILFASLSTASGLTVTKYTPLQNKPNPYHWCTGIFFVNGHECVVSLKDSRLFFRQTGEDSFSVSPLTLNQPHSVAYNSRDRLYYLVDTDNHRLISFTNLKDGSSLSTVNSIGGVPLKRPHDVIVDPETGWVYVLNPVPTIVFRFKNVGVQEELLDLSSILQYSRSLTLKNGKIFVVGSSTGKVVEIDDFSLAKIKVYQSAGKKKIISSGNWQETGLVPNDLEHYQGFWYATFYFSPASCTIDHCDFDKNKFIRFSSWQDFEKGKWEDLSDLLPSGLVPYSLTVYDDALFVALYNHSFPGKGDAIYRLVAEE